MAKIVVSSSSDRDEREIDEYHDKGNSSGSSSESSGSESGLTDKQYSYGVPGVPLEVLQKEMRRRVASGSSASPSISVQPSIPSPSEMVDIIYSCSVGVSSKIDEMRLYMLRANIKFLTKSILVLLSLVNNVVHQILLGLVYMRLNFQGDLGRL